MPINEKSLIHEHEKRTEINYSTTKIRVIRVYPWLINKLIQRKIGKFNKKYYPCLPIK